MFTAIRHAIARHRFRKAFGHFDQQAAECRKHHKRGVKDAMESKRRAVRLALMGNQTRIKV